MSEGTSAPAPTAVTRRWRIAVVGVGAVGGVLGARLQVAGHDVWFVARGATLETLRAHGLRVDSVDGDVQLPTVQVTDDPSQIGPVDLVLVAVKATQVAKVAPTLRPLLRDDTVVVPTQNGVEASTHLAEALGDAHVLEGVCRVIAEPVAPGHVRHSAVTPVLEVGVRLGASPHPAVAARIADVAQIMREAGMHGLTPANMTTASWEKFLFIEPIGAVCAASRQTFGTVRTTPETRALVDRALDEVLAVGTAMGVTWPEGAKAKVWKRYDGVPAGETTSLARDLLAGRPSEFDAQVGAVVRLAQRHGVSVPVHEVLHAILLPQVHTAG